MKFALVLLALFVVHSAAHMCLLFPHQRGSMEKLNTPGSSDCGLTKGPCGNRTAQTPMVTFKTGENASIVFQKNLNHWDMNTPGQFVVSVSDAEATRPLLKIPDTNTPSLTLYTLMVPMPKTPMDEAVLQVTYETKNPKAPADFYQCADIILRRPTKGFSVIWEETKSSVRTHAELERNHRKGPVRVCLSNWTEGRAGLLHVARSILNLYHD